MSRYERPVTVTRIFSAGLVGALVLGTAAIAADSEFTAFVEQTAQEQCEALETADGSGVEATRQWILGLIAQQKLDAQQAKTRVENLNKQLADAKGVLDLKKVELASTEAESFLWNRAIGLMQSAQGVETDIANIRSRLRITIEPGARAELESRLEKLEAELKKGVILMKDPEIAGILKTRLEDFRGGLPRYEEIGLSSAVLIGAVKAREASLKSERDLKNEIKVWSMVAENLESEIKQARTDSGDSATLVSALEDLHARIQPCLDGRSLASAPPPRTTPPPPATEPNLPVEPPAARRGIDFSLGLTLSGKWNISYERSQQRAGGDFGLEVRADGSRDGMVYFDQLGGLGLPAQGRIEPSGKVRFKATGADGGFVEMIGKVTPHPLLTAFLAGDGTVTYEAPSADFVDRGTGIWKAD